MHPYQGAQQSVPIRVTELYSIHYNKSSNFFNSFLGHGIQIFITESRRRLLDFCIAEIRTSGHRKSIALQLRLLWNRGSADSF